MFNSDLWIGLGALAFAAQGSPNVTGSGSLFQSAYPGDILIVYGVGGAGTVWMSEIVGPDSGTTVSSNTALVLQQNWPFTTLAVGQGGWSIIPCSLRRSNTVTTATAIANFIANYSAVLSFTAQSQTATLNKASVADNAGWVFTTAGITKSRIGNFGDDNLHLQYSPTGSGWSDALVISQQGTISIGPSLRIDAKGNLLHNGDIAHGLDGQSPIISTRGGCLAAGSPDTGSVLYSNMSNAGIGAIVAWGQAGSALTFSTNAAGAATTERMRIDGSGNVGIGTSAPTQRLEVNGAVVAKKYCSNLSYNLANDGSSIILDAYTACICIRGAIPNNEFIDLLLRQGFSNPVIIGSSNYGSPPKRNYGIDGQTGKMTLSLSGGTAGTYYVCLNQLIAG